ncbi:hypothetical protein T484DRAFT_1791613 [Baffinella frigidus]|nr:hypothetical protein T484DRAFT_1791613 [Cryptophyta sp. CCMP2293]
MVIFTDAASEEGMWEMRRGLEGVTEVVVMALGEMRVAAFGEAVWAGQLEMDDEGGHTPELYQIWNEKSHLLKRAADLNPSLKICCESGQAFFWVDIGVFRNASQMPAFDRWPDNRLVSARVTGHADAEANCPSPAGRLVSARVTGHADAEANCPSRVVALDKTRILLLNVEPFSPEEKAFADPGVDLNYANRIGGGIFGGFAPATQEWHGLFYRALGIYLERGRPRGVDTDRVDTE